MAGAAGNKSQKSLSKAKSNGNLKVVPEKGQSWQKSGQILNPMDVGLKKEERKAPDNNKSGANVGKLNQTSDGNDEEKYTTQQNDDEKYTS